jgi:tRNA-2-methylthio-N6-dimethylallyladenosine synthase
LPGETEDDFNATTQLNHAVGFDHSFSFIYSSRPGTPAAQLPDEISAETKKQWLAILQTRIVQNTHQIGEAMVGTKQRIWWRAPRAKTPASWQDARKTIAWSTSTRPIHS